VVRINEVEPGYFNAFGARLLAGRPWNAGDADSTAATVMVSRSFVDKVLGGGEALGRRVRYVPNEDDDDDPGAVQATPWYEIVGVVSDLEANPMDPERVYAGLFHPLRPGKYPRVSIAVRMREGAPSAFIGRLRQITTQIDPTLRVSAMPMAAYHQQQVTALRLIGLVLGLVILSVLLLSAAGIYALMSFTVSQRRHEIGIRAALGGDPRRILRGIFSRAVRQLGGGLALGLVAAAVMDVATGGELLSGRGLVLLPAVCLVMGTVGLLAALGPARRGLRIQPMEALREE
jgi:putative ABC transport system permease protein